jgi:myosin heavy subunit
MNGANEDRTFTVRHFAGDVAYDVAHFVAKNSETMEAMTTALLQAPGLQFLAAVAPSALEAAEAAAADAAAAAAEAGGGRGRKPEEARKVSQLLRRKSTLNKISTTTGRRFLQDMGALMAQLQASTAHFVPYP